MIGGPQGSGINASAEVFAKACSRAGLRVYANIEYHSNIMGKHSFYRVRVDDEDVRSYKDKADILVALDLETLAGDGDHRRWATHWAISARSTTAAASFSTARSASIRRRRTGRTCASTRCRSWRSSRRRSRRSARASRRAGM